MTWEQTTKSEATASENWQNEALQLIAGIVELSESITRTAQANEQDPKMTQWVLRRGEMIQSLLAVITPERIAVLPSTLSEAIEGQLGLIQRLDNSANQAFTASMATIHQQLLGLQPGKKTLRGYHLASGNQSEYTRSKDV